MSRRTERATRKLSHSYADRSQPGVIRTPIQPTHSPDAVQSPPKRPQIDSPIGRIKGIESPEFSVGQLLDREIVGALIAEDRTPAIQPIERRMYGGVAVSGSATGSTDNNGADSLEVYYRVYVFPKEYKECKAKWGIPEIGQLIFTSPTGEVKICMPSLPTNEQVQKISENIASFQQPTA